jgi:hypothetical protein
MQEITLRDGSREVNVDVATTMLTLKKLLDEHPLVLADLFYLATTGDSWLLPGSQEVLGGLNVADDNGKVHGSIRNIVRNAVTVDRHSGTVGLRNPAWQARGRGGEDG